MGNGDDEAEASDIGREPDESDAVVEAVPMSVSDPEQAPVTQVAQMAQEDAGDAGDAEDSDVPVARTNRRGGNKKHMRDVRRRRQAMAKAARERDSEGGA